MKLIKVFSAGRFLLTPESSKISLPEGGVTMGGQKLILNEGWIRGESPSQWLVAAGVRLLAKPQASSHGLNIPIGAECPLTPGVATAGSLKMKEN